MGEAWVGLVGMSGVGKTTAGLELAKLLGWRFVDLDSEIERQSGMSPALIFRSEGEAGFRERERSALEGCLGLGRVVVALGAGAPTWPATQELLDAARAAGALVVWLDEEDALIAGRLGAASGRPLLAGLPDMAQAVASQRAARQEAYARASSHRCAPHGAAPQEVALRMAQELGLAGRAAP